MVPTPPKALTLNEFLKLLETKLTSEFIDFAESFSLMVGQLLSWLGE